MFYNQKLIKIFSDKNNSQTLTNIIKKYCITILVTLYVKSTVTTQLLI